MKQTDAEQNLQSVSGKQDTYLLLGMLPITVGVPQSFVFLLFWNWFVKPLGVPGIGYWQAFGLITLISFIRYKEQKTDGNSTDDGAKWFAPLYRLYRYYILFLLTGWVAHLLMLRGA